MEKYRGVGILNGGATRTAGGIEQLEYLRLQYAREDIQPTVETSNLESTFADGERHPAGSQVSFLIKMLEGQMVAFS